MKHENSWKGDKIQMEIIISAYLNIHDQNMKLCENSYKNNIAWMEKVFWKKIHLWKLMPRIMKLEWKIMNIDGQPKFMPTSVWQEHLSIVWYDF